MPMDPDDGPNAPKPYPVPPPLEQEPSVEPEPPRSSAADLLPPADTSQRRVRRHERESSQGRRRGGRRSRGEGSRGQGSRGQGSGGQGPGRRTWPQRILLSILALSVLASVSAASVVAYGLYKIEQIERIRVALSAAPPGTPENYLLVGSDTRETLGGSGLSEGAFVGDGADGSGQRADTIMIVRIDPEEESVEVLSLPRDLWLPIAGTDRSQRINTAYAGGPQRLVDTVETAFDLPIHHYVEVDFAGFAGLVSAVGGVPMQFDVPMRDMHSGLRIDSAGCHVLDAEMALAFARSRHLEYRTEDGWSVDGTGDLGRITRQQVFIRRSLDKLSQMGVGDAASLNRLANVAVDNVTLDDRLGLDSLLELGRRFGTFQGDALRTYALPVYSYRTSGGASVLGLEEAEAQPILNVFRGLPPDALSPVQVDEVTVLNGTGEAGQAGLVADALDEIGFGTEGVGDVEGERVDRTRIRFAPGAEARADLLERHLTSGADLHLDPSLGKGEIVLETGLDLTTISRRPRPPVERGPATTTTTTIEADGTDGTDGADGEDVVSTDTSSEPTTTTAQQATTTSTTEPVGIAPDPGASCA